VGLGIVDGAQVQGRVAHQLHQHAAATGEDTHAKGFLPRQPGNQLDAAAHHLLDQHTRKPCRGGMAACRCHDFGEGGFDGARIGQADAHSRPPPSCAADLATRF
jgi:hypothetical protein